MGRNVSRMNELYENFNIVCEILRCAYDEYLLSYQATGEDLSMALKQQN